MKYSPEAVFERIEEVLGSKANTLAEGALILRRDLLRWRDEVMMHRSIEPGDVIYVRHGAHGLAPAFVREVGAGAHEGELRVAKWSSSGSRLMSDRWTSPLDFRGFPDPQTAQLVMKKVTRVG